MSSPTNKKLYEKVKNLANKKFKSPSGIYRSSWIVKEYKKRGGKYSGKKNTKSGLSRWYKEKWVDLNRKTNGKYEKCGRKSAKKGVYPICRPSKRISNKTPRTFREISKKSIKKAKKDKSIIKSRGNIQFGKGFETNNNENKKDNGITSLVLIGLVFSLATFFY